MKTIYIYASICCVLSMSLLSCDDEEYSLNTDIIEMGTLESPATNTHLNIDTESSDPINFTWSPARSGDGGLVLYNILFDEEGGNFEEPIASFPANNGGGSNTFSISPANLNMIVAEAGIGQLETGNVIWTVEAISGYNRELFPESAVLSVTRPEGLTVFPAYLYIYGPATEGADMPGGVAFKEITNELPNQTLEPGTFESITKLTPGEFYIVDSNNPDSLVNHYYINEEGKIREGDQPTTFEGPEGVYRIRMNLSQSTITYELMTDLELYILANQIAKAKLTYIGNHTFESKNGYFDFLTPGAPEAPDWLGWEEERYRFRFMVDGVQSYIGSYHNEDMNGSLVEGQSAYNVRPNGDEPASYYNVYFLGPDAAYWQGAWKFADKYNGASFTVRIVFDPKADHYYHEFELN